MRTRRVEQKIFEERQQVFAAGMRVGQWAVENAKFRPEGRYPREDCYKLFDAVTRKVESSEGRAVVDANRVSVRDAFVQAQAKLAATPWAVAKYGTYREKLVDQVLEQAFLGGMAEGRAQGMRKRGC
jgi:hypothetical protein